MSSYQMVSKNGIEANLDKVQAILDMAATTTVGEIQLLTCQMTFLSRFLSRSTEWGLPFFKNIKKRDQFEWTAPMK